MSEIDILNIYAAQQIFIVSILCSSTVVGYINIYEISYSPNSCILLSPFYRGKKPRGLERLNNLTS